MDVLYSKIQTKTLANSYNVSRMQMGLNNQQVLLIGILVLRELYRYSLYNRTKTHTFKLVSVDFIRLTIEALVVDSKSARGDCLSFATWRGAAKACLVSVKQTERNRIQRMLEFVNMQKRTTI